MSYTFEYTYVIIAYLNDMKGLKEQYDTFMFNTFAEGEEIERYIKSNNDRYNRYVLYKRYL